jgi:hypothetical protein
MHSEKSNTGYAGGGRKKYWLYGEYKQKGVIRGSISAQPVKLKFFTV